MVRVKGLEPPRQRRQNLNSTKNTKRQTLSLNFSQDIAETNRESAKPGADDRAKKNPGALAGGTEVKSNYEAAKLPEQHTPELAIGATFYWDRGSGSVEPLRTFAGVVV